MTFIIAECAQGYAQPTISESIVLAKWLTRAAKSASADAVKFQLIIANELACVDYKYYDLFKSLELGEDGWRSVCSLALEVGIDLIVDIFGASSLALAEKIGISTIKLHPTDFCNDKLINLVANSTVITHVIAGSGGSTESEIRHLCASFLPTKKVTLLHGFQGYPTPREENALLRLTFLTSLKVLYGDNLQIGFADHADPLSSDSTHLAACSIGYGAKVIEKHLTLAKCLALEDCESALSPDEFLEFVAIVKACDDASGLNIQGSSGFTLGNSEFNYRNLVRRHVVAACDIDSNTILDEHHLVLKRSASLAPITSLEKVIGMKVLRACCKDHPFALEDLI